MLFTVSLYYIWSYVMLSVSYVLIDNENMGIETKSVENHAHTHGDILRNSITLTSIVVTELADTMKYGGGGLI